MVNVRTIRYLTHPFNLSPGQPEATINKGVAATACITGMQVTLAREHASYRNYMHHPLFFCKNDPLTSAS